MISDVEFRPEAKNDLQTAYFWYSEKYADLGDQFLRAIDNKISDIRDFPESNPVVYRHLRRAFLKRFPYSIFYRLTDSAIVVFSVMHVRKDPETWKKRGL